MTRSLKCRVAPAIAMVAVLALPTGASAEYLVPPDNSAVNQYTESLPTPRGPRDSEQDKGRPAPPPGKTLGKRNARRLQRRGKDGRAVAAFAAATKPGTERVAGAESEAESAVGAGNGGRPDSTPPRSAGVADRIAADRAEPTGSSAFAQVIGEATGTSSAGQLGLWLPLILLATAAGAIAYALRHQPQPH